MPALRRFPYTRVRAKTGTIGGFLFENRGIKLPRTLFHTIEVPFAPFDAVGADGKKRRTKTALSLEFIELPERPFRGYRALADKTVEFPLNPEPGYVDASMYLNDAHNPVDVYEISFGSFKRGLLEATLTFAIDFESEQSGYATSDGFQLEVVLRPQPVLIYDEIVKKAKRRTPRALLADFVDPAILGAVVREAGRVSVRLDEG
jgi:hypothetical protein